MTGALALRSLRRHPARTLLALAGIAVAAAMLLDMVMLGGGLERSFEQLLLGRGYQLRLSPRGTLPFDSEARITGLEAVLATAAADSAVVRAGPILGTNLHARLPDTTATLFAYGVRPAAQGIYEVTDGRDLRPGERGALLLSAPVMARHGWQVGDTLTLVGSLDPQLATERDAQRHVAVGTARFLYDYEGQPSVALALADLQALARPAATDAASVVMVEVAADSLAEGAAARLAAALPGVEVNSVAALVGHFRDRVVYFRQLAVILGVISLVVTVLLVATLLTITVNERLGEIATLRALGIHRATIVRQVMLEGLALTVLGGALGLGLGLLTARWLDRILTTFPGLPASISFFVAEPGALLRAAALLLLTGLLAGVGPAWLAARAPIAATLRQEAT